MLKPRLQGNLYHVSDKNHPLSNRYRHKIVHHGETFLAMAKQHKQEEVTATIVTKQCPHDAVKITSHINPSEQREK